MNNYDSWKLESFYQDESKCDVCAKRVGEDSLTLVEFDTEDLMMCEHCIEDRKKRMEKYYSSQEIREFFGE